MVEAILADIDNLSKPLRKFILTICTQWWTVSGRYNFINIARYSTYHEQSLRNGYSRGFDFQSFNCELIKKNCSRELILAFDPTFISKSGKYTEGLSYFWSGQEQKSKQGLEFGCLAVVDIKNQTAFHLNGIQTPDKKEPEKNKINLVEHYANFLLSSLPVIGSISTYMAVDGYFMKKEFILPLVGAWINIITKMRKDANLKCLFKGKQKGGRGRKKIHQGKVNLNKLNKRKWKVVYQDKKGS